VTFTFTNTGGNGWSYAATIPDADVSGGTTTGAPVTIVSGTMTFDNSGNLATANGTPVTSLAPDITGISLTNLADGASPMNLNWTAMDSSGNSLITQTSAGSATSASSADGFPSGSLSTFAVQPDGTIEGAFSNGQSVAIGRIALAQFGNEDGLARVGENSFQTTATSGQAVIGGPGSGGLGTLTGSSVEQSNVDMATEFSNMVVDQRGFEANAKVISAFDQVMQDTINIEH
jgi:flagellar hook protein FlgE